MKTEMIQTTSNRTVSVVAITEDGRPVTTQRDGVREAAKVVLQWHAEGSATMRSALGQRDVIVHAYLRVAELNETFFFNLNDGAHLLALQMMSK